MGTERHGARCSGTYAGPGGACSGYLVRGGDTSVWVDTGPGTLANLQRHVDLAIARRGRREPQPPRPLGRARRRAQRAEVRLPDRAHAGVLARLRCASSSRSCAVTRLSRPSGGGSSPTATRSRSAISSSRSRPHRPSGRDARRCASTQQRQVAALLRRHRARTGRSRRFGPGARPGALRGDVARARPREARRTCRPPGRAVGRGEAEVSDLVAHPPLADGLTRGRHEAEAAEAFGRPVGVAVPGKTFTV